MLRSSLEVCSSCIQQTTCWLRACGNLELEQRSVSVTLGWEIVPDHLIRVRKPTNSPSNNKRKSLYHRPWFLQDSLNSLPASGRATLQNAIKNSRGCQG